MASGNSSRTRAISPASSERWVCQYAPWRAAEAADAALQDGVRGDPLVVREAIHHHLADDAPDAMRLRGAERGVQAVLPDRAVAHEGGRAGGRHGPEHLGRQALGGGHVVVALE